MKLYWTAGLAAAGLAMLLAAGDRAAAQDKKRERKTTKRPAGKPGDVPQPKRSTPPQRGKKTTVPPKTTPAPRPKVFVPPKSGGKKKGTPKTGGGVPPKTGKRPPVTSKKSPVITGKKRPPVTVGKKRPPVVIGKKRPPVGTLPGLGKRPTIGKRPAGIIVGGRQPRIAASGAARIAELRRRNVALTRQMQIARTRPTFRTRRDWQAWHGDYYSRYRWINGYWGGPWLTRWDSYWGRRWQRRYPVLLGFGITWWGLNRIGYQCGYYDYYNPYAGEPIALGGGVTCDYSQPLVQPLPGDGMDQEATAAALARKAFMEGNYRLALSDVNDALRGAPQDAALQQFRALVLFALGDYKGAAAPLNGVLAVGPGWDWPTIRGLYPDAATYTKQFRALEKYVSDNPKDAAGHFVLAYHYISLGHAEFALKQFQQAADLEPKDPVAKQMVTMLTKGSAKDNPNEADNEPPLPGGTGTAAPAGASAVTLEKLTGNWTAKRGKETFNLVMTKEDRFTWTHVDASGKKTEVKGVYALEKGALALEMDSGGVMLANVSFKGDKELSFRMVNDNDKDAGLTFTR
jgi:tetratricopeptide (TPR) repeat protein